MAKMKKKLRKEVHVFRFLIMGLLAVIALGIAVTYVTVYSYRSKAMVDEDSGGGLTNETENLDKQETDASGVDSAERQALTDLKAADKTADTNQGEDKPADSGQDSDKPAGTSGQGTGGAEDDSGSGGHAGPAGDKRVGCLSNDDPDGSCSNYPCQNNNPYCADNGQCKCGN